MPRDHSPNDDAATSADQARAVRPYSGGVVGPPWILGHRGAPREAPENTLVALRRALDLGLDGIEYDLQALASGEAVLLHDDTLDRTTDHVGHVSELTLPELAGVDAGGWFHKKFRGEPLPLLEEALALPVAVGASAPLHMIEVKDPTLVPEVTRVVEEMRAAEPGVERGVRLASFDRAACREAEERGLPAMLLAVRASEDDRRFVRDAGITAYSVGPGGWDDTTMRDAAWDVERWAWSLDDPDELVWAARTPLFGWNTNEPHRALAARALARLAPEQTRWPVRVPTLEIEPDPRTAGTHGPWSGEWAIQATIENPFPFPVQATADLLVRGGAFEIEGLPASLDLAARGASDLAFRVAGGSWSPGEDPRLLVRLAWGAGPRGGAGVGAGAGELVLDTTLVRARTVALPAGPKEARRLPMLVERPGDRAASMVVSRRGADLVLKVENPGGLSDVRALLRLGADVHHGAVGVRARWPEALDSDEGQRSGVPFSAGFTGRDDSGALVTRRWAGGVPAGLAHGAPGRLYN